MSSAEILEWVTGWPWPIIIAVVVLIAVGIERIISWDKQDVFEDKSLRLIPDDKCLCQCK
jgi:hypothetical protein